ncbi:hypothetical protein H4Q26_016850 [Puccinia striiformis f. sp. tritici PST-130]|nr:hypothetical protein H4Q26_016850 [Puccinia striiformis f. sp. tritici PST-130]
MFSSSTFFAYLMVAALAVQLVLHLKSARRLHLYDPPTSTTPPASALTKSPKANLTSTPEPESPTSTTTAPPAGASSKAETTPSTGGTPSKNVKDPKNKNGTHSTDKKASQSAPSPISQSTFELMTAFLSVGLLAIMV